jgi:replicative DNA helicase
MQKPTKNYDISTLVFDPQTSSQLAVQMVDNLRKDAGGGIKSGINDLDKILLPFRPGELVTVLGYTSNYKSGFMNWLSKQALKLIEKENAQQEIVVRVTWEQSVEEDTISWLAGDADLSITKLARGLVDEKEWKILQKSSIKRAITPMWIVGHSQQENEDRRRARPRMTMSDVALALEFICNDATEQKLKPKMIVLDYLQRIRPDTKDGDSKREQMLEAVNRAKDAAIAFGCPVVLGVQTGRDSLERQDKTPTIDDGQETSNIEQSSDKMFGVWYPIKTEQPGSSIHGVAVTKNLLIMRLLKQKLGEAPKTFALYVDPEKNILGNIAKGV